MLGRVLIVFDRLKIKMGLRPPPKEVFFFFHRRLLFTEGHRGLSKYFKVAE